MASSHPTAEDLHQGGKDDEILPGRGISSELHCQDVWQIAVLKMVEKKRAVNAVSCNVDMTI